MSRAEHLNQKQSDRYILQPMPPTLTTTALVDKIIPNKILHAANTLVISKISPINAKLMLVNKN